MFKRLIVTTECLALVGLAAYASASPPAGTSAPAQTSTSRGERWVRSHPFHISALSSWADGKLWEVDQYREGGFNTLLVWDPWDTLFQKSAEAGFPFHYNVHHRHGKTPQDYVDHVQKIVDKYPVCTGLLVHDEPVLWQLEKVRTICDALKESFPGMLVYSNALPMGARRATKYGFETEDNAPDDFYQIYVDQFAKVVNGDVLMVDIYPINDGHSSLYFLNLEIIRRKGLELGIPYWLFIQSWDRGGGKPSESDLRFQLFALLAYGFKGISYFTYEPLRGPAITDKESKPTSLYYHALRANMEVANLGKTLRFLKSSGIGFVTGQHTNNGNRQNNPTPSGMRHWSSLKTRPQQLLDIVIEDSGSGKDALLGTFEDDHGHDYFMIVNLWHHETMSASDAAQTVVLKFDSKAKYVTRLSRETGVCEKLVLSNGLLQLKLHGGTGDLFKLHDEQFPGL